MSHGHPNTSDPSDTITDNTFLTSDLLRTFVKENIFLLAYFCSFGIDLSGFLSCTITL